MATSNDMHRRSSGNAFRNRPPEAPVGKSAPARDEPSAAATDVLAEFNLAAVTWQS